MGTLELAKTNAKLKKDRRELIEKMSHLDEDDLVKLNATLIK